MRIALQEIVPYGPRLRLCQLKNKMATGLYISEALEKESETLGHGKD